MRMEPMQVGPGMVVFRIRDEGGVDIFYFGGWG